jgi:GTP-binding protein HflX
MRGNKVSDMIELDEIKEKVILIGVSLQEDDDTEESLEEPI